MKLYTRLTRHELEKLGELAQLERRRVQDQAAVLILEGLRLRGLITPGATDPRDGTDAAHEARDD